MQEYKPPLGRVITFYSYKGGTGRSMALANVAWLLALSGSKVLVVDWDLEAPGLHRYFRPFLEDPELTHSEGIIDFVIAFTEASSAQPASPPEGWYKSYANLLRYAKPLEYDFPEGATLDFISAGRQTAAYAGRVNSFNWKSFYENLSGWPVLDEARSRMRQVYDYVLIDSRTGVSDTAGICTVQMPDTLVVCFTLNLQSVDGASAAAASVIEQRIKRNAPIDVLPVPTRVDTTEKAKTDIMKKFAKPKMLMLLPDEMPSSEKERFWGEMTVPYIAFYAFEENLSWFRDDPNDEGTVLKAMLRIAARLKGSELEIPPLEADEKAQVIAAYDAFSSAVPTPAASEEEQRPSVLLLAGDAETALLRDWLDMQRVQVIASSRALPASNDSIRRASKRATAVLVPIDASGITSQQRQELAYLARFRETKLPIDPSAVLVLLPGSRPNTLPRLLLPCRAIDRRNTNHEQSELALLLEYPTADVGSRIPVCPFPGLQPFTEDDATVFFGREDLVAQIREALLDSPAVAVVGSPGMGRTSCIRAGVIPALSAQYGGISNLRFQDLSTADIKVPLDESSPVVFACFDLTNASAKLSELLQSTSKLPLNSSRRLLLVGTPQQVDQVERLAGTRFIRIAIDQPGGTELVFYIRRVAETCRMQVEDVFLDTVLRNAGLANFSLAALQFVLVRMWELNPNSLTQESYRAVGGELAVGRYLDDLVRSSGQPEARVLTVLSRFAGPVTGDTSMFIRRAVSASELSSPELALLKPFLDSGMIERLPFYSGQRSENYQFTHDIFVNQWPLLRSYILENSKFLSWRERFSRAYEVWKNYQRDDQLLQGGTLEEAKQFLGVRQSEFSQEETDYIHRSAAKAEETLAAYALARKQGRRRKRLIWTGAAIALLCVVAII